MKGNLNQFWLVRHEGKTGSRTSEKVCVGGSTSFPLHSNPVNQDGELVYEESDTLTIAEQKDEKNLALVSNHLGAALTNTKTAIPPNI